VRFFTAAFVAIVFASNLPAQTVVVNDNVTFTYTNFEFFRGFQLNVQQDAAATNASIAGFTYDGSTIAPAYADLDGAADWFVVGPGDNFSRATIRAGHFMPLVTQPYQFHPPAFVGTGDFYIGVSTGVSTGQIPPFPERTRTAYGWVQLRPEGNNLIMVSNVVAYYARGIRVRTTTLVPEPTTLAAAACGLALLIGLPRRSRRSLSPKFS
jgi:hypothetical protein